MTNYFIGFGFSLLLTFFSFLLAPQLGALALPLLILSALLQLFVQLYYFLHVGREGMKGSYTVIMSFAAVIVGILVGGTIWIMTNLDHLHMSPVTPRQLYQNGIVAPQNELK